MNNSSTASADTTEQKTDISGYAILLTPSAIETLEDRRGRAYMKARVTAVMNDGRKVERTLMARGKALDAVSSHLEVGKSSRLRVMFSKTDQGAPFLTALCMARHQPTDTPVAANDEAELKAA